MDGASGDNLPLYNRNVTWPHTNMRHTQVTHGQHKGDAHAKVLPLSHRYVARGTATGETDAVTWWRAAKETWVATTGILVWKRSAPIAIMLTQEHMNPCTQIYIHTLSNIKKDIICVLVEVIVITKELCLISHKNNMVRTFRTLFFFLALHLFNVEKSGCLTWDKTTAAARAVLPIPNSAFWYFCMSRQWYAWQCLGSLMCALTLMRAVANGGCMDNVRKSALKVDSGRKILCWTGKLNLSQRRASLMLYQLSYIPAPTSKYP